MVGDSCTLHPLKPTIISVNSAAVVVVTPHFHPRRSSNPTSPAVPGDTFRKVSANVAIPESDRWWKYHHGRRAKVGDLPPGRTSGLLPNSWLVVWPTPVGSDLTRIGSDLTRIGSDLTRIGSGATRIGCKAAPVGFEVKHIGSQARGVASNLTPVGSGPTPVGSGPASGGSEAAVVGWAVHTLPRKANYLTFRGNGVRGSRRGGAGQEWALTRRGGAASGCLARRSAPSAHQRRLARRAGRCGRRRVAPDTPIGPLHSPRGWRASACR